MLSLVFIDNNTGHDDIILTIGAREIVVDSYYFALDQGVLPDRKDTVKIQLVLKRLLEQLLRAIPDEKTETIVYFPYGFFDQGTYWLKCEFKDDLVSIYSGWSGIEGYSFSPSDIGEHLNLVSDFKADGASVNLSKAEFYEKVNESLSKAI